MKIHPCSEIFSLGQLFGAAESDASRHAGTAAARGLVQAPQRARLRAVIEKLTGPGEAFTEIFPFTTDALTTLREEIIDNPNALEWRLGEILRDCCARRCDELKRDLYFQVDPQMVDRVLHSGKGWDASAERFRDAQEDMREASQCLGPLGEECSQDVGANLRHAILAVTAEKRDHRRLAHQVASRLMRCRRRSRSE